MLRISLMAAPAMLIGTAILFVAGCGRTDSGSATNKGGASPVSEGQTAQASSAEDNTDHGHKPGEHGGIIVSLGRDSYHVEAMFETGGQLHLYMLGQDESRVQEVESQELTAYAKAEDSAQAVSFKLKPEPQPGDAEGKTSKFVGRLPEELDGKNVDITVPSIRVAGERFRLGFSSTSEEHGSDEMPAKVANDEEERLYLTPAGLYTEADIKANGNMTASEKFKGFRAAHDLKPKAGDKICPVTLTKANPQVTWVVGGKTYEFCCPPCVDEFVALAKESPSEIKEPEDYVKE